MENLETQVAKIEIGNNKQTSTYVFVLAETDPDTLSELFIIVELPLFNPAAAPDCERLAQIIAAALRRSYRKHISENTFENSLTQINEELANLAELGKTHWVGKLNALVSAKTDDNLHISTTGKIHALLLRGGEFISVADSPLVHHPLKTFENFALGKLKLGDTLIFSTSQLFNHLSVDRLKNILRDSSLPAAAQQVIEILQDNAGPEIAFGALMSTQVEPGSIPEFEEEIDLEEYMAASGGWQQWPKRAWSSIANLLRRGAGAAMDLIKNRKRAEVIQLINKNRQNLAAAAENARRNLSPQKFAQFSRTKKFFLISALVLLVALIANIAIGAHYKSVRAKAEQIKNTFAAIGNNLNNVNASYLYGDEANATAALKNIQDQINTLNDLNPTQQQELDNINKQVAELRDKIERKESLEPTAVATLSSADSLIKLPNYFATQTGEAIISYNRGNGNIQDNILKSSETIVRSVPVKPGLAVIYNGTSLMAWNSDTGSLGSPFVQNVPTAERATGLAYYPINRRVYIVDKSAGDVLSFIVGDTNLSKPVVSIDTIDDARRAVDLAVDGAIYLLTDSGRIGKYVSGSPVEFNQPGLFVPISGRGRIYSQSDFKYLYVLDPENRRMLILDKKGGVVKQLVSGQFNNLKDFAIDEKNRIIFVLNDNSLLKINF